MQTFVTMTKADYDTLSHELMNVQKLRVNVVMFSHRKLADFRATISRAEVSVKLFLQSNPIVLTSVQALRLGFEGFLLDFVEAPEDVLTALCALPNFRNRLRLFLARCFAIKWMFLINRFLQPVTTH